MITHSSALRIWYRLLRHLCRFIHTYILIPGTDKQHHQPQICATTTHPEGLWRKQHGIPTQSAGFIPAVPGCYSEGAAVWWRLLLGVDKFWQDFLTVCILEGSLKRRVSMRRPVTPIAVMEVGEHEEHHRHGQP